MSVRDKYHPDYHKLYPSVSISADVMQVLRQSDRELKYMEVDLKLEQFYRDRGTGKPVFRPSREDSVERLAEEENTDFPSPDTSPEEAVIRMDEISRLRQAMKKILPEERALILALFFEGKTEKEMARRLGLTQQGISWRLTTILKKLRIFMN